MEGTMDKKNDQRNLTPAIWAPKKIIAKLPLIFPLAKNQFCYVCLFQVL